VETDLKTFSKRHMKVYKRGWD